MLGDTPFARVGRAPKMMLIYRAGEPTATRRFKAAQGDDDGIEILGNGAQFVAYGSHQDTGRPYQWVGDMAPPRPGHSTRRRSPRRRSKRFSIGVHAIMPLASNAGNTGGTRGTGKGFGTVVRDADGMVIDGRETFLARCTGSPPRGPSQPGHSVRTIATAAWTQFSAEADLSDGNGNRRTRRKKPRGDAPHC